MTFEEEVASNRLRFLNIAKQYCNFDSVAAEDLVQDTIVRMLTNKDKFTEGTSMSAWGYMILRNLFINDYRCKMRRPVEVELQSDWTMNLQSVNADEGICEADILALIDKLPKQNKEAFNYVIAGYKYDEIADKLQIPIGTVKSRIYLARQALIEQITKESYKADIEISTINYKSNDMLQPIDKTENLKALFKYLFEFCDNEWKSVSTDPLTPIYIKHKLDHNWGAAIMFALANCNEFQVTGGKGGVKYRSCTSCTPNYTRLAQIVIDYRNEQKESVKQRKEYVTSVGKDTTLLKPGNTEKTNAKLYETPAIVVANNEIPSKSQSITIQSATMQSVREYEATSGINIKEPVIDTESNVHMQSIKTMLFNKSEERKHFDLDDICYTMYDNKIIELEVVGVFRKGTVYLHNLYNDKYKVDVQDMLVTDLFDSPEKLTEFLLEVYRNSVK